MNTLLTAAWAMCLSLVVALLPMSAVQAGEQDAQLAWQKIHSGATLIDVRTAEEFAAGHLPGAINIPLQQLPDAVVRSGIARETPLVLYCRSGRRSEMAREILSAAGYTRLYNAGGYQALLDAGKQNAARPSAGKACPDDGKVC